MSSKYLFETSQEVIKVILVKKRWKLIMTGMDRKNIKINNHHIYVNNKPHKS